MADVWLGRFRISGTNWEGRKWHLAVGGVTLAEEVNALWPRKHALDGTVAGKGHDERSPRSDHRPFPHAAVSGAVVRALDVGENVEDDGQAFFDMLRETRDPRIKYVLHEDKIFSSYGNSSRDPWEVGSQSVGHYGHVHVSLTPLADTDASPWGLVQGGEDMQLPAERRADVLELAQKGHIVADINYYFPTPGQPSADLPAEVWVNVAIAALGGVSRAVGQTAGRPASEIRKIIADAISNG